MFLWNTRGKCSSFSSILNGSFFGIELISENRIALGLNGLIEILQMDEEFEQINSRIIIKHGKVSQGILTIGLLAI